MADPPRDPLARAGDPVLDFEQQTLARAEAHQLQGHFAEAAFAWQTLALLRPEHTEYAQRLASVNQRAQALAAERLQRARQAQAKGDPAAAEAGFLSVLAVQPDHAEAAASLRNIERARMQRVLGQPSRIVLARRFSTAPNIKPAAADPLELEQVLMFAEQGEIDEGIGNLERRLAAQPRDDATRRVLATLYFKRAQVLQTSDPRAARAALASSLRLEPAHAEAQALLKQLTASASKPTPDKAGPPRTNPR